MEYVILALLVVNLIFMCVLVIKSFNNKNNNDDLYKEWNKYTIEVNKLLSNLNHDVTTSVLKTNMEVKDGIVTTINDQLNSIRNNLEIKLNFY